MARGEPTPHRVSAAPWPLSVPVKEGSLAPHAGSGEMRATPAGIEACGAWETAPPGYAWPRRLAGCLEVVCPPKLHPGVAQGLAERRQWAPSLTSPRLELDSVRDEGAIGGRQPAALRCWAAS